LVARNPDSLTVNCFILVSNALKNIGTSENLGWPIIQQEREVGRSKQIHRRDRGTYSAMPRSGVTKQRHESKVRVPLHMKVKQREAALAGYHECAPFTSQSEAGDNQKRSEKHGSKYRVVLFQGDYGSSILL
jgi:hypothetical protein